MHINILEAIKDGTKTRWTVAAVPLAHKAFRVGLFPQHWVCFPRISESATELRSTFMRLEERSFQFEGKRQPSGVL